MIKNLINILQDYFSREDVVMDNPPQLYPQLYSTSGHKSNSESSEGREDYFDNSDIVRPGDNVIPDFRNFVKTPKILTREGREQLRSLRSNL